MTEVESLARAGVALIGLVVAIVLRRRLGRAARFAIAALTVLSLADLATVAWRHYLTAVLSRPEAGMLKATPPYALSVDTPKSSSDLLDVDDWVFRGATVATAIGLALLVTAILAGRSDRSDRSDAPETVTPSPDVA